MSHDRGLRLQNALAQYLSDWFPDADSAGAGRPGTDVTGTPGVVWECKTARRFRPLEFVRQAKVHAAVRAASHLEPRPPIPVVIYWPEGVGEASVSSTLAILPLGQLMRLLKEAGYC